MLKAPPFCGNSKYGDFLTPWYRFWMSVIMIANSCQRFLLQKLVEGKKFVQPVWQKKKKRSGSARTSELIHFSLFFFPLVTKSRDDFWAVALFCRADDETAAVWKFVSCVGYKLVLHSFSLRTGWLCQFLRWRLGSRISLVSRAKYLCLKVSARLGLRFTRKITTKLRLSSSFFKKWLKYMEFVGFWELNWVVACRVSSPWECS